MTSFGMRLSFFTEQKFKFKYLNPIEIKNKTNYLHKKPYHISIYFS